MSAAGSKPREPSRRVHRARVLGASRPATPAESTLDAAFGALADPTRRGVVRLLQARARRAGELAEHLDVTPPALSRHLKVLREAGLVVEEALPEDARVRLYRLDGAAFATARAWLDEVEDHWREQLAAFRDYAERTRRPGPSR